MSDEERAYLEKHNSRHRREWFLQRIGWVVWVLLIVAGLAGLLGEGPLSSTEAVSEDGIISVRFDRFLHRFHPVTLEVLLSLKEPREDLQLAISRSLLDHIQIEHIEPEPESCVLGDQEVIYSFPLRPATRTAKVAVHLQYEHYGQVTGQIGAVDTPPVEIRQYVYP